MTHALDHDHAHRLRARSARAAPTSVNATNALSPRPAAIANGYFPTTPIAIVITPAASAVTVST